MAMPACSSNTFITVVVLTSVSSAAVEKVIDSSLSNFIIRITVACEILFPGKENGLFSGKGF